MVTYLLLMSHAVRFFPISIALTFKFQAISYISYKLHDMIYSLKSAHLACQTYLTVDQPLG